VVKKLTLKTKIIRRLQKGMKPREIAEALGCNVSQVYVVKSEWKKGGNAGGSAGIDKALESRIEQMQEPLYTVISDPINPDHYKQHNGIETIDFIEACDLNYRLGNVVKYVSRANHKGNYLEDLKKARWYLDREISHHER